MSRSKSSLKVIGQGHQDQCHYQKNMSEKIVTKVKAKDIVEGKGHQVQGQTCWLDPSPPSSRGRFDTGVFSFDNVVRIYM